MIQLYHGDCLDILKTFKDNSIDCVITSPPYNMGLRIKGDKYIKRTEKSKISTKYHNFKDDLTMAEYYDFTKKVLTELLRVSDLVFYNIQFLTGNKVALFKIIGDFAEKIKDIIIWDKVLAQPAMAENVLNSRFEVILILQNSKPYSRVFDTAVFGRGTLNNLWQIKPDKNNNPKHKAIFPKELCSTIISNFTKEGDTILDCFMGTGTTGAVAKELDRNFIGIEIDEEYFTMAKERINQPTIENFLNN